MVTSNALGAGGGFNMPNVLLNTGVRPLLNYGYGRVRTMELNYDKEKALAARKRLEEAASSKVILDVSYERARYGPYFNSKCEKCGNLLKFKNGGEFQITMHARCCNISYGMFPEYIQFTTFRGWSPEEYQEMIYYKDLDEECPTCKTTTLYRKCSPAAHQDRCKTCDYWDGLMYG